MSQAFLVRDGMIHFIGRIEIPGIFQIFHVKVKTGFLCALSSVEHISRLPFSAFAGFAVVIYIIDITKKA